MHLTCTRWLCLVSAALLVSSPGFGDDAKDEKAAPKPRKPPELKVLERFVGTWNTKMTQKVAEWTPKEVRTSGTTTNAWVLGGRFIQCAGSDSLPTEWIAYWTYDHNKKAYRTWFFNSVGDDPDWSGQWDKDAKSLIVKNDMGNGIEGTLTARFLGKDTIEWHAVAKDNDGKVYYALDSRWTRRK